MTFLIVVGVFIIILCTVACSFAASSDTPRKALPYFGVSVLVVILMGLLYSPKKVPEPEYIVDNPELYYPTVNDEYRDKCYEQHGNHSDMCSSF